MILASNKITFQKLSLSVLTFLNNLKALKNFWKIIRSWPRFLIPTISETVSCTKSEYKLL